jgi:hypothetical protein
VCNLSLQLLGALGMIDANESDWKVIVINTADTLAATYNDISDVPQVGCWQVRFNCMFAYSVGSKLSWQTAAWTEFSLSEPCLRCGSAMYGSTLQPTGSEVRVLPSLICMVQHHGLLLAAPLRIGHADVINYGVKK